MSDERFHLSALVLIATKCPDDSFIPGTRFPRAAPATSRSTMPAGVPGRHMRARTVVPGTVVACSDRPTDASNGHRRDTFRTKLAAYRHHGEI